MKKQFSRSARGRRLASMMFGSLAIIVLAASPALAHSRTGATESVRHNLLVAELVGADATEATELESMLEIEDGVGQVDSVDVSGQDSQDSQADSVDVSGQDSQADQSNDGSDGVDADIAETDSPDGSDASGSSGETTTDGGSLDGSNSGSLDSGD